ncbi:alpha/beta fold hydrolase [Streptomyces longispororuber]|uniref:alpha/beta fold hydrolase n=1 Tax=Streptomyces longispororuber TaxID=68230 RepID=UPI00210CECF2|nr:alpha/beta fold hydrolase [Streptomyces longispororuber]MCQ4209812.1 alpha/beta hydrolase [Streptomyces longispororuber]
MTAFVLVSGGYTAGWIWRDVAAALRGDGHQVYPATLTGLGDRRHLARPTTGLDTHVEDLVQLVDHVPEHDVVLVGHCYGIHPALGAASRRPERIVRLVYLDAGLPGDGDSCMDLVTDEVRGYLLERAAAEGDGVRVPPPPLSEARVWGDLRDLDADARERLAGHAAPMPLAVLTQPLRMAAPLDPELPTTGVFCTLGGGPGIATIASLVATGDPRFAPLARPTVGYFELATGHWPMLSAPREVAGVLLRAAADEGERLTLGEGAGEAAAG